MTSLKLLNVALKANPLIFTSKYGTESKKPKKAPPAKSATKAKEPNKNEPPRKEKDSMGEVEIPAGKLYGSQTARYHKNFPIGVYYDKMPFSVIKALAILKKACACANFHYGMDSKLIKAINAVCDEIICTDKLYREGHFPLPIWQSGTGSCTNYNINEVISNKANLILGGQLGSKEPVHPMNHVNKNQSSNDVFNAAVHIAIALDIKNILFPGMKRLTTAFLEKAEKYNDVIKIGRTHGQDAVPMTVGQELKAFATQLCYGFKRVEDTLPNLYMLSLGGNEVGSGVNTPVGFAEKVASNVARITGLPFEKARNLVESVSCQDSLVEVNGALNTIAGGLMKMAMDIKLLSSGPRCGINELTLPANEPGSSIMPGKVNPTHCDMTTMIACQVMGNSVATTIGASSCDHQVNLFQPMIAFNTLRSIMLLGTGCDLLAKHTICGMKVNEQRVQMLMDRSLMLSTALSPHIGYDKAAKIALKAFKEGTTLKESAKSMGVSESDFDKWVVPKNMTEPEDCNQ